MPPVCLVAVSSAVTRAPLSLWLTAVTDIDIGAGRVLIDSMTNEVIVRDQSIKDLIPIQPMSYDDAVRSALRERREDQESGS